jgi:ABC-type sugar transport system ATPase subunit
MRVSDRVAVMRLGEKVFEAPTATTTSHDIVMQITGAAQGADDETTRAVLREHRSNDEKAEWA